MKISDHVVSEAFKDYFKKAERKMKMCVRHFDPLCFPLSVHPPAWRCE